MISSGCLALSRPQVYLTKLTIGPNYILAGNITTTVAIMSSPQHQVTAWQEVALWLDIQQLVVLLLMGNRWMSAVLSRAPNLAVTGKFYPILEALQGLVTWEIPSDYPVVAGRDGVVGRFPANLRSLTLAMSDERQINQVVLPLSLTSLTIASSISLSGSYWVSENNQWLIAIAGLPNIISVEFGRQTQIRVSDLAAIPNSVTNLSINHLLDNDNRVKLADKVILKSLTALKVAKYNGSERAMIAFNAVIAGMSNLQSLFIPSKVVDIGEVERSNNPSILRSLPAQLHTLNIAGSLRNAGIDVVGAFPSGITSLTLTMDIKTSESLEVFERLPLQELDLTSTFHKYQTFNANLPNMVKLTLYGFLNVNAPVSTRSLSISRESSASTAIIHLLPGTLLHELAIPSLDEITNLEERTKSLSSVTDVDISQFVTADVGPTLDEQLLWMNPSILHSLRLKGSFEISAVIAKLVNADKLRNLDLESTDPREFGLAAGLVSRYPAPVLPVELPKFLTRLQIYNAGGELFTITEIPTSVVELGVIGAKIDTSELVHCADLVKLTLGIEQIIDSSITANIAVNIPPQVISFLTHLPAQVRSLTVMESTLTYPIHSSGILGLDHWLKDGLCKFDVRLVTAVILNTFRSSIRLGQLVQNYE